MHTPLKQRLKLFRQKLYAAAKFRGHVPVDIRDDPLGAVISVEGHEIVVPSLLRWKLYKKGWSTRLDQLENEYGVRRHVMLSPQSVVLDIGANAGEFAHICARYGARVFCLEPDPKVFACLKVNIADLPNAAAFDTLIWKEDTEINFFSVPERADSSVFAESEGPATKTKAVTVESFCRAQSIRRIDLLKCDAEGAEPEVLQGIGAMFPHISVIALDTGAERKGQRTNEACTTILKQHGFDVIDEKIGKRLMTFGINRSSAG